MFDLVVILNVTDAVNVAAVTEALARMRTIVLEEPGCVRWEALHSSDDPTRVVLVERWDDRDAWEAHDSLSGIQEVYLPNVLPFVTREIHESRRLGVGDESRAG